MALIWVWAERRSFFSLPEVSTCLQYLLFNQNELNIFMTDSTDEGKIAKFLSDFSKRIRRISGVGSAMGNVMIEY